MSLADRIAEIRDDKGRPCRLMQLYERLSDEDKAAVDGVIESLRDMRAHGSVIHTSNVPVSGASLARALSAEGHPISKDAAQAHIYYRCGCLNGSQ